MKLNQLLHNQNHINRWIVSYADFITMLLALFMVMYALSQLDISNLKDFSQSVGNEFEVPVNSKEAPDYISYGQKKFLLNIFNTTETSVSFNDVDVSNQSDEITGLKNQLTNIEKTINKEAIEFENIKSLIELKFANTDGVSVTRESRGLLIRLNDKIFFDTGSAIIKEKSLTVLDKLAGILKDIDNPVKIEGHTDNVPIKTVKYPSNWELSTARSTNIIKYLVEKHNIVPQRLSAVGYGEYMPIQKNSSAEGRAANRRVDIVVLSSTSKIFDPVSVKNN